MLSRIFDSNNRFNEKEGYKFLVDLLNIEIHNQLDIKIQTNSKDVNYIYDVGMYTDLDGFNILAVILNINKPVETSRSLQRNTIGNHMRDLGADVAIAFTYSNKCEDCRLSFVKINTSLEYDENSEKYKILEELTPTKRYSFLIDPYIVNNTVKMQLKDIYNNIDEQPTADKLESVFNIEIVTNQFFDMYSKKCSELAYLLVNDSNFTDEVIRAYSDSNINTIEILADRFSKRLMSQIAFLYFLQKKGWLGVRLLPEVIPITSLNQILKNATDRQKILVYKLYSKRDTENAYMLKSVLDNILGIQIDEVVSLFIGTELDYPWGTGSRTFLRDLYEEAVKFNMSFFNDYLEPLFYEALNKKRGLCDYFKKFNCKIPFLNGNLFEPVLNYDYKYIDLNIPNSFFVNDEGTGVLDYFDLYNFTVNENESLEKEVAVDPEMLGKIFESIVNDKYSHNDITYTSKNIVHFMCQESLIKYLERKTNIDPTSIELFIKFGDIISDTDIHLDRCNYKMPEPIINNLLLIDFALANVTVVDPAVGSGTFILGMMNEIVKARRVITKYLTKDLIKGNNINYMKNSSRRVYQLKKNAMRNSLFAVDIEPDAVALTKLRLWLSLVVDAPNSRMEILPNLDYNVMVGNSLVDEFMGEKFCDATLNQVNEINKLQVSLFDEIDPDIKQTIKSRIDEYELGFITSNLSKNNISRRDTDEFMRLRSLGKKHYFLWELYFNKVFRKGGFDIVIGNPPNIKISENKELFDYLKMTNFGKRNFENMMNFYYYFFSLALNILKDNGLLCFVTSNDFLTSDSAYKLRCDLRGRACILEMVNFNRIKNFENNLISITIKQYDNTAICKVIDLNQNGYDRLDEKMLKDVRYLHNNELYSDDGLKIHWRTLNHIHKNEHPKDSILSKISKSTDATIENYFNISKGVDSGLDKIKDNGVFIISEEELKELKPNKYEMSKIKKVCKNSDILKYIIKDSCKYLLYTTEILNIKESPNIIRHLMKFRNELESRKSRKSKYGMRWYYLDAPKDVKVLNSIKIVSPSRATKNHFALDYGDIYAMSDVCILSPKKKISNKLDIKYVLAFLNSKINYIWCINNMSMNNRYMSFNISNLNSIPLKIVDEETQKIFIDEVDKIINTRSLTEYDIILNNIDNMFYRLFDLTEDEIKYIEDETNT